MRFSKRSGMIAALLAVSSLGFAAASGPSSNMAAAASRFLASLTPAQRLQATFAFDSSERTRWHFIPTENHPRLGLTIKQMSEPQRTLAHALLQAGLSQRGYLTATQIMELELVLRALEAANPVRARDPERYFFSIFGTPSTERTWGWRVEGHHMSLHFTIVNGKIAAGGPSFFGTNPAEIRDGPRKGTRILALEEDAARALLNALDAAQREKAVIDAIAPNDIVTMNTVKIDPLSPSGIAAANLTDAQRTLLMRLVDVYVGRMADDVAAETRARIEQAGWDGVSFAWAGPLDRGHKHYYRVQGPTFLIEYDNTQNDANHVHSVWRDFNRDFGADLLREHVRGTLHE